MPNDLIKGFPVLETKRLMLRESNSDLMKKAMQEMEDRELMHFYGLRRQEELAVERERARLGMSTAYISFKVWYLITRDEPRVIGHCGYHDWAFRHFRAELGYVMSDVDFRKKGLMTEALEAVIEYGFEQMNLNRIEACVGPNNAPSLRLVENMGFRREGYLRQHYFSEGVLHDSLAFSLLKEEWERK